MHVCQAPRVDLMFLSQAWVHQHHSLFGRSVPPNDTPGLLEERNRININNPANRPIDRGNQVADRSANPVRVGPERWRLAGRPASLVLGSPRIGPVLAGFPAGPSRRDPVAGRGLGPLRRPGRRG